MEEWVSALGERGSYQLDTQALTFTPFDHLGDPEQKRFQFQLADSTLTLVSADGNLTYVYHFEAGSAADVLAREQVDKDLVGTWTRRIPYAGTEAYTFRPDGYFIKIDTPDDTQFPPDVRRGRYLREGMRVQLSPYAEVEAACDLDFFGTTLVLITVDPDQAEFRPERSEASIE